MTIRQIQTAIQQPIKYAGPGHWEVFERPKRISELGSSMAALPIATESDLCLMVSPGLWVTFQELSLWVEALCIHETHPVKPTYELLGEALPEHGHREEAAAAFGAPQSVRRGVRLPKGVAARRGARKTYRSM